MREPERVIPRAIVLALAGAVVVYVVVAVAVLSVLGGDGTAASTAPVADAVSADLVGPLGRRVVRVGRRAGLGRCAAGPGRGTRAGPGWRWRARVTCPRWLDAVHPRFRVPHRAELTVAAVVVVLVLTTDLRGAIGFSSFGVLLYYFVANASAYRQPSSARRFPRWLQVLGCTGCLVLVATLPWQAIVAGIAVFAVGIAGAGGAALALTRPADPRERSVICTRAPAWRRLCGDNGALQEAKPPH